MFTWICPQCGREVPPSSTECPDCANRDYTQSPQVPIMQPATPLPRTERPSKTQLKPSVKVAIGIPAWLLALLFAMGFLVMGSLGFFAYTRLSGRGSAASQAQGRPEGDRPPAATHSGTLDPAVLLKYIEVTGLRLVEDDPQNLRIRFLVVNHSQAPLTDLAGTVTLRPTTAKRDGEVVGTFAFRIPELGPNESRELTSPMKSKLRIYELPDWEFLRPDLSITSP